MQKKDDRPVDNTATGRNDQKFSGPGTDPNLMRYDQPGTNNGPGPGFTPSQHPYPNEANYTGMDTSDHSKHSRFGGKVQTAIGTMVGSDTLRAKGMEKERFVCFISRLISPRLSSLFPHTRREARNLNMQSSELAQAESLEREAQMHRDRAMGGGRYF